MSEFQKLNIPNIDLEWSPWMPWTTLEQSTAIVEGKKTGVYEVRYLNSADRLHIGKSGNQQSLRSRVYSMVHGKPNHSTGKKIFVREMRANLETRWAVTDRPAAAEEELHLLHRQQHNGELPKYDNHT